MATTGVSSVRKTNPRGFMALLSSAVCEWFLIFLLFVDAAFSYLLLKFAQYCELPTPCLFCSRIGHSFGKRKHESYRSLLCSNHREEISSLVSCHVHGNLADVCGMCEECFMPFSMQNKLNSGSYRLLVGKLGLDIERHGVQSLILHRKFLPSPSGLRICSCCNKSWGERSNAQRLLQLTPVGFGASKANIKPPLPRAPGRSRFSRRESFKKLRDKFSGPASPKSVGNSGGDPLSHVGYTELKIHSDSESEVPFSDDDDGGSAFQGINDMKAKNDAQHRTRRQPKIQTDDAAFYKQSHQATRHVASLLDQPMQLDVGKHNNVNTLASDAFSAHGLEELNWEQPHPRPHIQALPELISLDDVTQAPDVAEAPVGASADISKPIDPLSHMSSFSLLSEHILLNNIPASSNVMGNPKNSNSHDKGNTSLVGKHSINAIGFSPSISNDVNPTNTSAGVDNEREVSDKPVGPLSASDSSKVEDMKSMSQVSASDHDESHRVNSHDKGNTSLLAKHSINAIGFSNNAAPSMSNDMNPTNTSAGIDNEREASDRPVEPLSASDSSKVEDMKSMPQVSVSDHDESQRGDASSSDGIHIQMLASSGRNDSGPESLDGVSVGDIEGESVVYRLNQSMNALHKELEEERNAAAIAANQAMAMINRLQEEKAALHMEALQYLRMMDEQAEYDMEALEKANDLLAEKEKEIQDLEAELEHYKNNFQGEVVQDPHKKISSLKGESTITGDSSVVHTESGPSVASHSESSKITKANDISDNANSSVSNFEDEKLYLVQWLKKLERRLHEISGSGACTDVRSGRYSEQKPNKVDNQEDLPTSGGDQIYHKKELNGLQMQNGLSALNGSSTQDNSADLVEDGDIVSEKNNHISNNWQKLSTCGGEMSLANLENEIANFADRLQALETDRDFLNHACSALRNGNDGLQFIQEIVQQLQELRKIEFEKRCLSVP